MCVEVGSIASNLFLLSKILSLGLQSRGGCVASIVAAVEGHVQCNGTVHISIDAGEARGSSRKRHSSVINY